MTTATADTELDTDALSDQLAGDLGADLGAETDTEVAEHATDALVDDAAGKDPAEVDSGAPERDPVTGKFTGKAPAASPPPAGDPKTAAPADPAAAATELPAPKSWAKDMHPIWDKLAKGVPLNAEESRKAATYYNEREKQMLDGLQGYKTDAEYGKALRSATSSHEALLKSQGLDLPQAVGYLLNAHAQLSGGTPESRMAYLGKIAETYGLKLPTAAADPNAPPPPQLPPEVRALQDQVAQLTGAMTERQQQELAQQRERMAGEVNAFVDAKDEKGNLKHPYFDEVAPDLINLIAAEQQAGRQPDLGKLYEAAVWANPVTRQKELARIDTERKAEDLKKTQAAVQAAKRATSTNVRGRDTTRAPQAAPASLDNLESVMRETHEEIKSKVA